VRKKGKYGWEREKRECKNWRSFFFALNFWLSLTSTLQQSRIPLSKILDPPLLQEILDHLILMGFIMAIAVIILLS